MPTRIPLRLLEVNSPLIWHWPHLQQVINVIKRDRFTGLIIHQQDLLALLVKPSLWCQHGRENLLRERQERLLYLQRLYRYCNQSGIRVWLQGEALPQGGKLLEKYPQYALIENSQADESFWKEFYLKELDETLSHLPGIEGLIINLPGHLAYRASGSLTLPWLYQTLRAHGKRLVLRDYIEDNAAPSWQLINALKILPPDVRVSLKAVASGYRPGFSNNPLFAQLEGRIKWIEFDMWGLEYGWTLLPCYLLEELQGRLSWAENVAGDQLEAITGRLSWEWVSNSSLINSVNSINLHGLAMFGNEMLMPEKQAFHCWLTDILNHKVTQSELNAFHQIYTYSYEWMTKTPYIHGHLLHQNSQVPESYAQAIKLLQLHARQSENYTPSVLFPIDAPEKGLEQYQRLFLEKERALFLAQNSRSQLHYTLQHIAIPDEKRALFKRVWERMLQYTNMFDEVCKCVAMKMMTERYGKKSGISVFSQTEQINRLRYFAHQLDEWLDKEEQHQPHYLAMLFDPARLHRLADSLTEKDA
ncbi:hypothetical protein ACTVHN_14030 [Escherichia coli]|uniref:hypothetical protein n=1 Tax=Escherichia coli TaxID=562 RepID=UPI000E0BE30A|nr:hypothetical protein [Escherichia coli]EFJ7564201.1 hypothetical protein [Escherichia coli]EFO0777417.1 hypothetical protein [Escherichia coli]EFO2907394.1 hypothetical protein [Escherichia coli]EFP0168539.1 hypothetical protein [Escherichia coli]EHW5549320.1 hypothetical protein [Escherichia coli]